MKIQAKQRTALAVKKKAAAVAAAAAAKVSAQLFINYFVIFFYIKAIFKLKIRFLIYNYTFQRHFYFGLNLIVYNMCPK